jgi:DNA-binding beta-propeller fold protein YncE
MKQLIALLSLLCVSASAGTLFCGAYPNWVLVIDEAQGKVTDKIKLETGLPTSVRMSNDKKTLFVTTNDHSGVEVIDVATHKVTNHFVLNDPTHRYRLQGGAPDPEGKLLYTTTTQTTKQIDRYELGKPKYTIIDLVAQKIAKTVDQPTNDATGGGDVATAGGAGGGGGGGGGGRGGGAFEVSPDGKFLYQFGQTVTVMNSADFSVVDHIQLAQPEAPAMENLGLGGQLDAISEPGQRVSIFNYSDPIVHNRVFGLARFDLNTRKFDFTAIGPSPMGMTGLHITPDKKFGYTVSTNGVGGNKRCEFWGMDLSNSKIARTGEFPCRSRYSFGISANGKKLYIYGAGYEIDVYDAATFKHEATWDLGHDMTGGGMVVLP